MATNIRPFFSHYIGFDEEAHALFALHFPAVGPPKMPLLLIGTNCGRCLLFSSVSLRQLAVLHEDTERRQIVAIGRWPFDEKGASANASSSAVASSECVIWLHFRCHSVALFELLSGTDEEVEKVTAAASFQFRPLRELTTGHYGFCRAVSDAAGGRMFMPDHEGLSSSLRIRYRTGGERMLILGEEFMRKRWARRNTKQSIESNTCDMFKGLLMGIAVLSQELLLLAFEDSTVCVFNVRTNEVVDALKHPTRPEFLCWSVLPFTAPSSRTNGIDMPPRRRALVAVSVIGQLYLLSYCSAAAGFDDEETRQENDGDKATNVDGQQSTSPPSLLRAECKVNKCTRESECTAVAFHCGSSSSQNCDDNAKRMASGFKDGIIEIRAVIPSLSSSAHADGGQSAAGDGWTTALLFKCNFHACAAIHVLCWIDADTFVAVPLDADGNDATIENNALRHSPIADHCSPHPQMLVSGASDGKVSLFFDNSK